MLDRSEVLRYLGYGNKDCGEEIHSLIDQCEAELDKCAKKASLYRLFDAKVGSEVVIGCSLKIESKSLVKHLAGCEKVAALGATLGVQVDYAIMRYSKTDVSKALVFHACAATLVEQVCDEKTVEITAEADNMGFKLLPRFSPGYGDLSLKYNFDLVRLLDAEKRIGLTVTESFGLAPSKSVTAIIGLTKGENACASGCDVCMNRDTCQFRKG